MCTTCGCGEADVRLTTVGVDVPAAHQHAHSASSWPRPARTLEGAALEIEEQRGRAHCRTCGEDFSLADPILLCACGSADVELLSGRELAGESVEVG